MSASVAPPQGLEPEREFPAQSYPDNIPLWTENYCFVAYDPISQVGLWTHLGRAPFDSTLWRELSIVYLPSGERLVNKGYGRSETPRGPGGATMTFECVDPFRQWRIEPRRWLHPYDGGPAISRHGWRPAPRTRGLRSHPRLLRGDLGLG